MARSLTMALRPRERTGRRNLSHCRPEDLPKLSDDPIRMYLTQMAEIPLLTREQEISLAKKIEVTRKRFRRSVLGCDFAMQVTIDTLDKVHQGELPFDRTIKVSLTERLTKEQILARMPHNLKTLRHMLAAQPRRFPQAHPPQHRASRIGCKRASGSVAAAARRCSWSKS